MSERLKACPLCGHAAKLEVAESDRRVVVRCCYCGLEFSSPSSRDLGEINRNKQYVVDCWNNRAEHCQYCGSLIGSAEECPECGKVVRPL